MPRAPLPDKKESRKELERKIRSLWEEMGVGTEINVSPTLPTEMKFFMENNGFVAIEGHYKTGKNTLAKITIPQHFNSEIYDTPLFVSGAEMFGQTILETLGKISADNSGVFAVASPQAKKLIICYVMVEDEGKFKGGACTMSEEYKFFTQPSPPSEAPEAATEDPMGMD